MKHVPNLLTALRLLALPFIWKWMWEGEYGWGLAIGAVASISDAVDGWVARKFNATSKLGAALDPIADKLMLSGTYLILGHRLEVPGWLVWIIIGRDVFILFCAAAAYLFTSLRDFPPSRWGKLSTLVQILTLLVVLVNRIFGIITYDLEHWMIWLCGGMTVGSAIHYLWQAINRLGSAGTTNR